uniref:Uncharacterized protein n=1 Tax=Physcomitrium patens TaxID=3218 RepID=A0A2K1J8C5_PHYPA|nr:hypothetical protein PHYPA_020887 [Physcomitrium patens]
MLSVGHEGESTRRHIGVATAFLPWYRSQAFSSAIWSTAIEPSSHRDVLHA